MLEPGPLVTVSEVTSLRMWQWWKCREDLLWRDEALVDCVVWQEPLTSEAGHG